MRYYANYGPDHGPLLYGRVPGAIGVLEAPDKPMPIGMATSVGWDRNGPALWRLTIHDAEVPGLWVVVDREFQRRNKTPQPSRPGQGGGAMIEIVAMLVIVAALIFMVRRWAANRQD
jgi:hypothetical protein